MVVGTVSTECWWDVGQVSLTLAVYQVSEADQGRSDNNQVLSSSQLAVRGRQWFIDTRGENPKRLCSVLIELNEIFNRQNEYLFGV